MCANDCHMQAITVILSLPSILTLGVTLNRQRDNIRMCPPLGSVHGLQRGDS